MRLDAAPCPTGGSELAAGRQIAGAPFQPERTAVISVEHMAGVPAGTLARLVALRVLARHLAASAAPGSGRDARHEQRPALAVVGLIVRFLAVSRHHSKASWVFIPPGFPAFLADMHWYA
jgi:hypothetical protein